MPTLSELFNNLSQLFRDLIYLSIALFAAYILFHYVLKRLIKKANTLLHKIHVPLELIYAPVQFLIPAIILLIVLPFMALPQKFIDIINHALIIWFITSFAWLTLRIFSVLKTAIQAQYNIDAKDNLKARQITTQLAVIQRVVGVVIFILAVSAILMTFEEVRQIGVSILASAGLAGVILGFAAQRSLGTLIAGIQIAITQPIRIDDVVIIENEWGRIEEITLTYVVVNIWDQRRLVVPITYFLEKPFQNWTRKTSELIGTVFIYTDYGIAVDSLRNVLQDIVKESHHWDKRLAKLQVTNASEKGIELRALVSAENSSNAWELRCEVREKLIDYLQRTYPDKLPRVRLEPAINISTDSNHT